MIYIIPSIILWPPHVSSIPNLNPVVSNTFHNYSRNRISTTHLASTWLRQIATNYELFDLYGWKAHHPEVRRRLVFVSPVVVVYAAWICIKSGHIYSYPWTENIFRKAIKCKLNRGWSLTKKGKIPLKELFPILSTCHLFDGILSFACHSRSWCRCIESLLSKYRQQAGKEG